MLLSTRVPTKFSLILNLVQHMATAGENIYCHGFRCVQYCCTGTCGTYMLLKSSIVSNIIPLLRSTLLLVCLEMEELTHNDLVQYGCESFLTNAVPMQCQSVQTSNIFWPSYISSEHVFRRTYTSTGYFQFFFFLKKNSDGEKWSQIAVRNA